MQINHLYQNMQKVAHYLATELVVDKARLRSTLEYMVSKCELRTALSYYSCDVNDSQYNIISLFEKIDVNVNMTQSDIDLLCDRLKKRRISIDLQKIGGSTFENLFLELYAGHTFTNSDHIATGMIPTINVDLVIRERSDKSMCSMQ